MLARAIEETGLPTVTIALIKEHAQRVKPPRALWVPFPFGCALGKPNDPEFQHKTLAAALSLLPLGADPSRPAPILAEFPEDGDALARLVQASDARPDLTAPTADPANEITALRGYYERWTAEHDNRTAVGLSGVPQRQFRGLVRYLQAFARGDDASYDLAPQELPAGRFLRLASDDLKAFYFEARFSQRPDQQHNDLQRWFWAETAMGPLLASVAARLSEQGDNRSAQGIAR